MSNDLVIDVADEDGVVISDKSQDRCYIYFTEIPEVIRKLKEKYDNNYNEVKATSIGNKGVSG